MHQYEQGGSGAGPIAPGSYSALVSAFNIIEEWANKFRPLHPEWFNPAVKPLSFAQVVGTDSAPGASANTAARRAFSPLVRPSSSCRKIDENSPCAASGCPLTSQHIHLVFGQFLLARKP